MLSQRIMNELQGLVGQLSTETLKAVSIITVGVTIGRVVRGGVNQTQGNSDSGM